MSAGLILALVGYLLPIVVVFGADFARYGDARHQDGFIDHIVDYHRQVELDDLMDFGPNLGCMLLFGLSGFANYSPARFPGLLRTMTRIGVATVGGVVFMLIMTIVFQLGPQSYTSDPYVLLRFSIIAAVPIAYTTWIVFGQRKDEESDEPT